MSLAADDDDDRDACWSACLELSALESGSLPSAGRRNLAGHLLGCVDCQILLAVCVVEWETEYTVPRPPQSIERWRAVALHLSSGQSDADDPGCIADPHERAWWWRDETQRLEDLVARTGWSLDGEHEQEGRVQRWLGEIESIARAHGGLGPEEPDP
jgi:hypothetical protein